MKQYPELLFQVTVKISGWFQAYYRWSWIDLFLNWQLDRCHWSTITNFNHPTKYLGYSWHIDYRSSWNSISRWPWKIDSRCLSLTNFTTSFHWYLWWFGKSNKTENWSSIDNCVSSSETKLLLSYFDFIFLGGITPKNHQYVLPLFTDTLGIANIIPIF